MRKEKIFVYSWQKNKPPIHEQKMKKYSWIRKKKYATNSRIKNENIFVHSWQQK